MKKTLIFTIIVSVLFLLSDPFFTFCDKWADIHSLGAELALGLITPWMFLSFISCAFFFVGSSAFMCFRERNAKHLIPILILAVTAVVYISFSNADSFWVRLVNFYLSNPYS